jgi:hypothetical protein
MGRAGIEPATLGLKVPRNHSFSLPGALSSTLLMVAVLPGVLCTMPTSCGVERLANHCGP